MRKSAISARRSRSGKTRFVFPDEFSAEDIRRPFFRTREVVRYLCLSRGMRPRRQVRDYAEGRVWIDGSDTQDTTPKHISIRFSLLFGGLIMSSLVVMIPVGIL
jgi:hypothetical protein